MTSYSVLKATNGRASIIGTWPGFESEEHSVKVSHMAASQADSDTLVSMDARCGSIPIPQWQPLSRS